MEFIKYIELKNIKENIYFLDCNDINICINGIWLGKEDNILYNYHQNINELIKFMNKNKYITKENYFQKDKNYLSINIKTKLSLTDYLLNTIYSYIYYYRTVLEKKFYNIIKKI